MGDLAIEPLNRKPPFGLDKGVAAPIAFAITSALKCEAQDRGDGDGEGAQSNVVHS